VSNGVGGGRGLGRVAAERSGSPHQWDPRRTTTAASPHPRRLGQLASLQLLDLSYNNISAPPPATWSAPHLAYLYLRGNPGLAARGALPPAWAGAFPALKRADVAPPPRAGAPRAEAPRVWQQAFCARYQTFVCLAAQRGSVGAAALQRWQRRRRRRRMLQAAGRDRGAWRDAGDAGDDEDEGGCSYYLRAASTVHFDSANGCDHPGSLPAAALAWAAFLAAAGAMVAHHRRWAAARAPRRGGPGQAGAAGHGGGAWASPFAAYAKDPLPGSGGGGGGGGGGAAGARGRAAAPQNGRGRGRAGGTGLTAPLLAGAGSDGGSGGGGGGAAAAGYDAWGATGDGRSDSLPLVLPSALAFQTPPRWGEAPAPAPPVPALAAPLLQQQRRSRLLDGSGAGPSTSASVTSRGPAAPPARGAAASPPRCTAMSGGGGSGGGGGGVGAPRGPPQGEPAPSFLDLALPLAIAVADAAANARLLALWGFGPLHADPAVWASILLLVLLLLPHAAAAGLELLRVLAAGAALPPALRAASTAAMPWERAAAALCGWVMAGPWWAAWPALALLAAPCLALLT
jgi:hypothetical protein